MRDNWLKDATGNLAIAFIVGTAELGAFLLAGKLLVRAKETYDKLYGERKGKE